MTLDHYAGVLDRIARALEKANDLYERQAKNNEEILRLMRLREARSDRYERERNRMRDDN